jgi:Flp pilus assembly protein TadG
MHTDWFVRKNARRDQTSTSKEKRERGQSILEMTFALPILLLILIAVIDLSRAFDAYIVLTNAVREGARYGSRDPSMELTDIQNLVVADVTGSGTNVTNMDDFAPGNVAVEVGTRAVTVTATYDFELWFAGIVGFDSFPLEKRAAMPIMTGLQGSP